MNSADYMKTDLEPLTIELTSMQKESSSLNKIQFTDRSHLQDSDDAQNQSQDLLLGAMSPIQDSLQNVEDLLSKSTAIEQRHQFQGKSPQDYLKSVGFTIRLSQLLRVKSCSVIQMNYNFAGVLIDIVDVNLQKQYQCQYLLQAWSRKGEVEFERKLKYEVVSYITQSGYLMYMTDPREEGERFIYVVFLEKNNATFKIKDFTDPSFIHLNFVGNKVYMANDRDFKMVELKTLEPLKEEEVRIVDVKELKLTIWSTAIPQPLKMHGFFANSYSESQDYAMCNIELEDNQISTQRLYFWDDVDPGDEFEFLPYREIFIRKHIQNDPIVKFRQVINTNTFQFGVSLRKSGRVDLYYNYALKSETEDAYEDVEITFKNIFGLKRTGKLMNELRVYMIDQADAAARVSFQESKDAGLLKQRRWELIPLDAIKQHIRLFNSMTLGRRSFLVSHSNFVSIYDLIKNEWVQHIDFKVKINALRRDSEIGGNRKMYVILENGKIQMIEVLSKTITKNWNIIEDPQFTYQGKMRQICSDFVDICSHYLKSYDKKDNTHHLYYLNQSNVSKCDIELYSDDVLISFKDDHIQENEQYFELPTVRSKFILFSPEQKKMRFIEAGCLTEEVINLPNITQSNWQVHEHLSEAQIFNEQIKFIIKKDNDYLGFGCKKFSLFKHIEEKNYDVKFTEDNVEFANLILIENEYLYVIKEQTQKASGFYIQDLSSFYKESENGVRVDLSDAFKLKYALGGHSYHLNYYKQEERIAYQNDFQTVKIVPILHRNTLTFFGMRPRSEYFAFKKIKDAFIALDHTQNLTTWNATTGKMIRQIKIQQDLGLQDYKIYRESGTDNNFFMSWNQDTGVLLYNDTKEIEMNRKAFFKERYKEGINKARCNLDFEPITFYNFKLISIEDPSTVRVHFQFNHGKYGHNYQRIYFSDCRQYMLERLQNHLVFLYKKQDVVVSTGEVTWNIVRRVEQFSTDMSDFSYFNCCFTPNLMLYIDYSKADNKYMIRRTFDQSVYMDIPQGQFSPKSIDPIKIGKRFIFHTNTRFKLVNDECMEKVYDFSDPTMPPQPIAYCRVPMMNIDKYDYAASKAQFYQEYVLRNEDNIRERLERSVLSFKSAQSQIHLAEHNSHNNLHEHLYSIDFPRKEQGKVLIDMSFTYLHWKVAEALGNENISYSVNSVQADQFRMLILNIFPQGMTVLHYINDDPVEIKDFYEKISRINVEKGCKDEAPFIQNFEGKSPLHLSLENQNMQAVNTFLTHIKDAPIGNHARAIIDILPQILEEELPAFQSYLSARLLRTEALKKIDKGNLQINFTDHEYQLYTAQQWVDDVLLKKQALNEGEHLIQKEISVKILDIPELHSFQEERAIEFFNALSKVEDINLFSNEVIRCLIDFKWPLVKEFTVKMLFIPFLFYICLYITFSNAFNGQVTYTDEDQVKKFQLAKLIVIILLYILSIFFLGNELLQLYKQKLQEYFSSIWNFFDVLLPMLVLTVISYHLAEMQIMDYEKPNFIWSVHSLSSYLMWLKLYYFLRIFKHTGYLIRMLNTMIYSVKIFLLVLLIMYLGFGEAFLRLSEGSQEKAQFIEGYPHAILYSFRLSLGDMQTDTFDDSIQPITAWLLFILCILYTNIVMLNLLIAIVSEAFAHINSNAENANYQERASLIAENQYLIPDYRKRQFCSKNQYLIVVQENEQPEESKNDQQNDEIQKKIKSLEDKIDKILDKLNK